jgi:hypothetical protein
MAVIGCNILWFKGTLWEEGDAATLVAASGKKWTLFYAGADLV